MARQIKTPYLAVDLIIEHEGGIVLIKRKNPPYGWALPGGFVEIGESLEDAAIREAKEETSLNVELLEQFYTYSDPARDPRFHVVSVVFIAKGVGSLKGRDDAVSAEVFSENNLPQNLAFDHKKIIDDYFTYLRTGIRPSPKKVK
ncbi:MAG: NUDIX hydrolase [Desulfobacterota bacterium]|nr:NUDIX hydrolase [Thermodesulfobacteriota bacterium]MDW8002156.1 NUDIX hydrolase [Deltaproteobacteria bacterium]